MKVYFYSPFANSFASKIKSYDDLIKQKIGLEFWIERTYFMLSANSSLIEPIITDKIPEEGIIIFHKGYFPKSLQPGKNQYFICVQADYGRHKFAQLQIVQNPNQVFSYKVSKRTILDKIFQFSNTYYISHWPQSSIIARSSNRKNTIENLSFYGNLEQVAKGLETELSRFCFDNHLKYIPRYDSSSWNDYSKTDITLAIRSFSNNQYYHKPFSKLVNAVIAGSLVIAAPESSSLYFKEKYYPELPIVNSMNDLKKTIKIIKDNPVIHFEQLRLCNDKISDLRESGVIRQWERMLLFANKQFLNWQNSFASTRSLFLNYRSL